MGDGVALREHEESAHRQIAARGKTLPRMAERPDPPELPDELAYLWMWFLSLHHRRGGNGFGPNRIAWGEVAAWCSLHGIRLAAWELDAIMRLDDVFLLTMSKPGPNETSTAPRPDTSTAPPPPRKGDR